MMMTNQEAANLARSMSRVTREIEGEVLFTRWSDAAVCDHDESMKLADLIRHVAGEGMEILATNLAIAGALAHASEEGRSVSHPRKQGCDT